jgi:hypothetical protein
LSSANYKGQAKDALVKHVKKEIKNKNNNDEIIFYTFKILNAQFF